MFTVVSFSIMLEENEVVLLLFAGAGAGDGERQRRRQCLRSRRGGRPNSSLAVAGIGRRIRAAGLEPSRVRRHRVAGRDGRIGHRGD